MSDIIMFGVRVQHAVNGLSSVVVRITPDDRARLPRHRKVAANIRTRLYLQLSPERRPSNVKSSPRF